MKSVKNGLGILFLMIILLCGVQKAYCDDFENSLKKETLEQLQKKAQMGDPQAEALLGLTYATGFLGSPIDPQKAIDYWLKAAGKGNMYAEARLGYVYQEGAFGVKKDSAKAVSFWQKAAPQGNDLAQLGLGRAYQMGQGVAQDQNEAIKWYEKAADQGNPYALFLVYKMLLKADDAEQKQKGFHYCEQAAFQGHQPAQALLGAFYNMGNFVSKDLKISYAWLDLATEGTPSTSQTRDVFLLKEKTKSQLSDQDMEEAVQIKKDLMQKITVQQMTNMMINQINSDEKAHFK